MSMKRDDDGYLVETAGEAKSQSRGETPPSDMPVEIVPGCGPAFFGDLMGETPPAAAPEPWTQADEQFSAHDAPPEPIEPHVVPLDDPNVPVSLVHLSKYDALLASLHAIEQALRTEAAESETLVGTGKRIAADRITMALAQAEGKPSA